MRVSRHHRGSTECARPRPKHYRVIYADPPWTFSTYSRKGKGRSAEAYYDCMTLDRIKARTGRRMGGRRLRFVAVDDRPACCEKAFEVIRAWGFTYKTVGFYWAKAESPIRHSIHDRQLLYRDGVLDARKSGALPARDAWSRAAAAPMSAS